MKKQLAVITAALLSATLANAQNWEFFSVKPISYIEHTDGWVFAVTEDNGYLTVGECLDAPQEPGPLNFADPVINSKIVSIVGANVDGGILGDFHGRATSLILPEGLWNIGDYAFNRCDALTAMRSQGRSPSPKVSRTSGKARFCSASSSRGRWSSPISSRPSDTTPSVVAMASQT
jgi:hypothetical protein